MSADFLACAAEAAGYAMAPAEEYLESERKRDLELMEQIETASRVGGSSALASKLAEFYRNFAPRDWLGAWSGRAHA